MRYTLPSKLNQIATEGQVEMMGVKISDFLSIVVACAALTVGYFYALAYSYDQVLLTQMNLESSLFRLPSDELLLQIGRQIIITIAGILGFIFIILMTWQSIVAFKDNPKSQKYLEELIKLRIIGALIKKFINDFSNKSILYWKITGFISICFLFLIMLVGATALFRNAVDEATLVSQYLLRGPYSPDSHCVERIYLDDGDSFWGCVFRCQRGYCAIITKRQVLTIKQSAITKITHPNSSLEEKPGQHTSSSPFRLQLE